MIGLVAFGSVVPEAREVYDALETEVRAAFPHEDVAWTFTSSIVRRRLAEQGRAVPASSELVRRAARKGGRRLVLQSFHVTPGQEFATMQALVYPPVRIEIGAPLLWTEADRSAVVAALRGQLRVDAVNVLVGHGNATQPEHNRALLELAAEFQAVHPRLVVGSLEGEQPGREPLLAARPFVAATGGRVHFLPLLLVPGGHLRHDVLGTHDESWRNLLGARHCSHAPTLGQLPAIRALYCEHLRQAHARLHGA